MKIFPTFNQAILTAAEQMLHQSHRIHTGTWQGMDISKRPEAEMHEMLNWNFQVPLRGIEESTYWTDDIKPNLPFADVHFDERVGGRPTNPGEAYKIWPWGNAADKFRTQEGKFDHTYQERFWPKYAGVKEVGNKSPQPDQKSGDWDYIPHKGIRFEYGDLNDLVNHLASDPLTRQAYLPIWFPEDGTAKGRKPCTLGYWFIVRNGYMHMHYPIRSCDITRHFRDDCYMAVRLMVWILEALRNKDEEVWARIRPGLYSMWIGSFHCFLGDTLELKKWIRNGRNETLKDSLLQVLSV